MSENGVVGRQPLQRDARAFLGRGDAVALHRAGAVDDDCDVDRRALVALAGGEALEVEAEIDAAGLGVDSTVWPRSASTLISAALAVAGNARGAASVTASAAARIIDMAIAPHLQMWEQPMLGRGGSGLGRCRNGVGRNGLKKRSPRVAGEQRGAMMAKEVIGGASSSAAAVVDGDARLGALRGAVEARHETAP